MKLLQLNCWGGKLNTPLKRLINEQNPDIVCLQETTNLSQRPGSVVSSFREFLPENDYPYVYFDPVFSYRFMHEIAGFGNAIVSKVPFHKTHTVFTKGQFHEDLDNLKHDYNIRNFLDAEILFHGKKVHIITHHGHHDPKSKDGSYENTRQNNKIAEYISRLDAPVILAGDFNLHPRSSSLDSIHKLMKNLPVKYEILSTRTELAKRQEVIDFIFVSDNVIVNNFFVSEMIVSDHKALIIEFDV